MTDPIRPEVVATISRVQGDHLWSHTPTSHCSCGWKAEGFVDVIPQWTEHVAEEVHTAIRGDLLSSLAPVVEALDADQLPVHEFVHKIRNEVRR